MVEYFVTHDYVSYDYVGVFLFWSCGWRMSFDSGCDQTDFG